jgi:hypothetical protein
LPLAGSIRNSGVSELPRVALWVVLPELPVISPWLPWPRFRHSLRQKLPDRRDAAAQQHAAAAGIGAPGLGVLGLFRESFLSVMVLPFV